MSEPRRRRPFFQLHLATALILMVVSGGLLYLNCNGGRQRAFGRMLRRGQPSLIEISIDSYGWPFEAYQRYVYSGKETLPETYFHAWGMAGDIAVVLAALVCVALVCEWAWRVRERARD